MFVNAATPIKTLQQVVNGGPMTRLAQRITEASVRRSDCFASRVAARLPLTTASASTTGIPHRWQRGSAPASGHHRLFAALSSQRVVFSARA